MVPIIKCANQDANNVDLKDSADQYVVFVISYTVFSAEFHHVQNQNVQSAINTIFKKLPILTILVIFVEQAHRSAMMEFMTIPNATSVYVKNAMPNCLKTLTLPCLEA